MTDHVHGEGNYVKCDKFHVVSVSYYEDRHSNLPDELSIRRDCYCGEEATHVARVGFYTSTGDHWMQSQNRTLKAHRCDEHGFEEEA